MKSLKDLMVELGFNENADKDVAKAFLNNLNKAIDQNLRPEPIKQKPDFRPKTGAPQQLSFDFSDVDEIKKSS